MNSDGKDSKISKMAREGTNQHSNARLQVPDAAPNEAIKKQIKTLPVPEAVPKIQEEKCIKNPSEGTNHQGRMQRAILAWAGISRPGLQSHYCAWRAIAQ